MTSLPEELIFSERLGNSRRLWLQPTPSVAPRTVFVLLDAEYYLERMDVAEEVAELQLSVARNSGSASAPPVEASHDSPRPVAAGPDRSFAVCYVSHLDGATRWPESFCNERFAAFLADELVPRLRSIGFCNEDASVVVGGLSLTGLAAAHAVLTRPEIFHAALCQSASFWWSDNRIVKEIAGRPCPPRRFRIVCGTRETRENVDHGSGLFQRSSQLDSNRSMKAVLAASGHDVSYEEFDGGHDLASWKRDLPRSFTSLL